MTTKSNVIRLAKSSEVQTENTKRAGRLPNEAYRTREHLTEDEVLKVLDALKRNRYGQRDRLMGLLAFRHGLRVSELIDLQWSDIHWDQAQMLVRRLKGSQSAIHFLESDEVNGLKRLQREGPTNDRYIFVSERGTVLTRDGVLKMIKRAGEAAKMPFPIHPHMFRHAAGFKLANDGVTTRDVQHTLGHRNIAHSVRYTAMAARPLNVRWKR